MRTILLFLHVFTALASGEVKSSRTCRLLFLGAPPDAPQSLQLYDGARSREVELPRMNLSPVYELPAGPLVLHLLPTAPPAPEKVDPKAPKVTVGEAVTDLYLLVSSDRENTVTPVRMQLIDAGATKFRAGEMMWFNLTPNRVGGKVGDRQLSMEPNSKTVLEAPAGGNADYPVNLSYRMPDNERLYPLCETKWRRDPRARSLLFVVGQESGRTPRVIGFPDFREAKKDS